MPDFSLRKVYRLDVSAPQKMGVIARPLNYQYKGQAYSKTFDTLEAANKAMMDVKASDPPEDGEWVTFVREQFAFRDPNEPNKWHILSTSPCDILSQ